MDVAKLGSLKQQMSPQTKLFNWNIIITELEVSINDLTLYREWVLKLMQTLKVLSWQEIKRLSPRYSRLSTIKSSS